MKSVLFSFLALGSIACAGGNQGGAKGAEDVSCPSGQSYDGQFCVVDQKVATKEQVAPPEKEPEETEPVKEEPSSEEPAAQEGEGETQEEPPVEEHPEEGPTAVEPSHATPVDYAMAAQAAPVIHYVASSHLPAGARPLGAPVAGQFAEGQILEQKVQLVSGKCYTVVGVGLPPITELNLRLVGDEVDAPLAEDNTKGNQAVLGSQSQCYRAKESRSVTLVLSVEKGRGVAAAQVFQK